MSTHEYTKVLSCNGKCSDLICFFFLFSSDDESDDAYEENDYEEFDLFDLFSILNAFSRGRSFNQ